MAARKTSPKQTASEPPENKTAAPADAETTAITEETATTPDVATVATAQPEQEPAAAGEDKDVAAPANDTAPDGEKAEEEAEAVLVVTAPRERRRAGFAFGREPVRLRLSQLSDEQVLAIESDPLLSVRREQA